MLYIYQYSVCILYKTGLALYVVDWLSHYNHTEGKDQEIAGTNINMHRLSMATYIPVGTSIEDSRNAVTIEAEL